MKELTDPAFLTALATLITAITALIKVFHVEQTTKDNNRQIREVNEKTNGSVSELKGQVDTLKSHLATLEDTGYVGGHSDPHTGQSPVP